MDPNGRIVGAGGTEPAGGDHAEVVALRRAGGLAAGAIVVVTMEPCNHYGKTPPCVNALIEARVGTVVYAVADPNGIAGGGAGRLSAAGLQVRSGVLAEQVAAGPLREWLHKQRTGLPHVTWKYATSIDGRSAAADGSSQWISSEAARLDLHRRRAIADAILVGTGTVLADDPALTARLADGSLAPQQPLRVVVGKRDIPPEARVLNDEARTMMIRTHEPMEVLRALSDRTECCWKEVPPSPAPSYERVRSTGSWPTSHRSCWAVRLPRSMTSGCPTSPTRCVGSSTASKRSDRICC